MKIKKGDTVEVISGKDAGTQGRVLVIDRQSGAVGDRGRQYDQSGIPGPNPQKNVTGR